MEKVVEDEGNTIFEKTVNSVQDCEELCDKTDGCNSFNYCKQTYRNKCILRDKKLTGNEPSIFLENCASYYTAGKSQHW